VADQVPLSLISNITVFLSVTVSGVTTVTGPRLLFTLFADLLPPQSLNYSASPLIPVPFHT